MKSAVLGISTLTSRHQTTIPAAVRRALGLSSGDQLAFEFRDGAVLVRRAEDEADPVVSAFLDFLERDMGARPEDLVEVNETFLERGAAIVGDEPVDLDEPIEGDPFAA